VQFFGHEELSAKMAKPLLNDLIARDMLLVDEAKEVERRLLHCMERFHTG